MPVTREDVIRTAHLARLRLTEAEIEIMVNELNPIFEHFEKLKAVDTDGVEPLDHIIDASSSGEADIPHECLSREEALKNAPEHNEVYFKLPRVVK